VLELSDEGHDVVDYRYLTGASPAEVEGQIEHVARRYPSCLLLIEDNGPGYVVRQSLDLPEGRVQGFTISCSRCRTRPPKTRTFPNWRRAATGSRSASPGGFAHRLFRGTETNVNLHVFTAEILPRAGA
jgi:hypothetical protein